VGAVVMATFNEDDVRPARAVTTNRVYELSLPKFRTRTNYLKVN
jgi:hypothetical protein